jgi:hypothetical protein
LFVYGERFTGECGFIHLEIVNGAESEISGYLVAALEKDDVSGDDLFRRDAEAVAVSADGGFSDDQTCEGFDGFFCFGFLNEADDGVDEDDGENDDGVHPFLEGGGGEDGCQEDVNERLVELVEEAFPGGDSGFGTNSVGAKGLMAQGGFCAAESVLKVGLQELLSFRDGEMMKGGCGEGGHQ